MNILLIFIIVIIIGIALWQLKKIFEIAQVSMDNSQIASDKDNRLNGKLMFAFLGFLYILMLFSFWKWGDLLLPKAASAHGKEYDFLMNISFILIFFVQFVTQAVLHYFAYKYRGKKEGKAFFYHENHKLELIWTVIPIIALAVLITYGLRTWSKIMYPKENEKALVLGLYAQQFNWKARYAGVDNVLGEAHVRYLQEFDGKNIVGIDPDDPYGKDDVVVTQEIHLPVGREVILKMRSQDVIHSAYIPHFRVQMNCVPGMITQFAFTPTITTAQMRKNEDIVKKVNKINAIRTENNKELIAKGEETLEPYEFDYILLCNKICGASHYNMQMKIIVESEEEFQKWLAEQKTFAEVIQ